MGIGKTTMAIATHHVQHLINLARAHIDNNPELHFKSGSLTTETGIATVCPTNDRMIQKFGLDCPCAPCSPTFPLKASLGCGLIFVPRTLLTTWRREWTACYEDDDNLVTKKSNPFKMLLVTGHDSVKTSDPVYLHASRTRLLAHVEQLSSNDNRAPTWQPRVENSQVLCLTTSDSFVKQVLEKFKSTHTYRWTPPPGTRKDPKTGRDVPTKPRERTQDYSYSPVVFASVWRDESHLEKNRGVKTIGKLELPFWKVSRRWPEELRHPQYHLNVMSGTLVTAGPNDIAHYVTHMKRPEWKHHDELKKWMNDEAVTQGERFHNLVATQKLTAEEGAVFVKLFKPLIETLVLRFSPDTNFLGLGPVVVLPPNWYHVEHTVLDAAWARRVADHQQTEDAKLKEREAQRAKEWQRTHRSMKYYKPLTHGGSIFYRSRMYATAPALMDLNWDAGDGSGLVQLRCTDSEWREKLRAGDWLWEDNPYLNNFSTLCSSSSKLPAIKNAVKRFEQMEDGEGQRAAQVFASNFFVGAYLIYLVRIVRINNSDPLIVLVLNQSPTDTSRRRHLHPQRVAAAADR